MPLPLRTKKKPDLRVGLAVESQSERYRFHCRCVAVGYEPANPVLPGNIVSEVASRQNGKKCGITPICRDSGRLRGVISPQLPAARSMTAGRLLYLLAKCRTNQAGGRPASAHLAVVWRDAIARCRSRTADRLPIAPHHGGPSRRWPHWQVAMSCPSFRCSTAWWPSPLHRATKLPRSPSTVARWADGLVVVGAADGTMRVSGRPQAGRCVFTRFVLPLAEPSPGGGSRGSSP